MLRFGVKVRPKVPTGWAWQHCNGALLETVPYQQGAKKIPTDALGTIHTLVLDSVRPPRPESSNASMFRIRARGLEFDVDQCCFAQEQLTGPDPSGVPGSLIDYPYD